MEKAENVSPLCKRHYPQSLFKYTEQNLAKGESDKPDGPLQS